LGGSRRSLEERKKKELRQVHVHLLFMDPTGDEYSTRKLYKSFFQKKTIALQHLTEMVLQEILAMGLFWIISRNLCLLTSVISTQIPAAYFPYGRGGIGSTATTGSNTGSLHMRHLLGS